MIRMTYKPQRNKIYDNIKKKQILMTITDAFSHALHLQQVILLQSTREEEKMKQFNVIS